MARGGPRHLPARCWCCGYNRAAFVIGSNKATTSTAATVPATPKPSGLETAPLGTLLPYVDRRDPGSISLTIKGALEPTEERDMRALLDHLGFNASAVMNRLGNTRALDGTLSAEGRLATVYWTYHPDAGLSMVFEGKK